MMNDETRDPRLKARLESWQAPVATQAQRDHLLSQLALALPTRQPPRLLWAWLILRAQVRVVHRVIWAASTLILGIGALVSAILYRPGMEGADLPLALVAPFVAALGASFLYGEDVDPGIELQMTTPVGPALVLMARLALVFGFNLALTLLAAVPLALVGAHGAALGLVTAWLAPMTCLSALAFFGSVVLNEAGISAFISSAIWGVSVWRRFADAGALPPLVRALPDLFAAEARPVLFAVAALLVVVTLVISERGDTQERRYGL